MGTFGRFAETPADAMSQDMRDAYDTTRRLRGSIPGPQTIWLANPRLSRTVVPTGAYFQTESTLSKAEIEIATSVINGHWATVYSNSEHEEIGQELGGLTREQVDALIAGLPTAFDDPRQQVVYELASTLVARRWVPAGLHERAAELLGDAGIVDLTLLLGWFTAVSLTLAVYDVPADAVSIHNR